MYKKGIFILAFLVGTNTSYATNYTSTVAAGVGQIINLNIGDTVTLSSAFVGSALAAASTTGVINAPGVIINTANSNGFGVNATVGGTVNLTNGTSIKTTGTGAIAINSSSGIINANNISILTSGTAAHGVKATNTPITISNSTIQTLGQSTFGITANGLTARLRGSNLQISVSGINSAGLNAMTLSQFFLNNSSVLTTGLNSNGAQVIGATMTLTNNTITTQGSNSLGIFASATNAQLNGQALTVTTSGNGSHGVAVQNGGNVQLQSSFINTLGTNASALSISNAAGNTSSITVDAGSLNSQQFDAINAQNGIANITLKNGTTVNNGSGNVINATNTSQLNFIANNNIALNGNVLVDLSSTVNMSLLNNSTWRGAATNLTNLTIDSSSSWNVTANSNITQTLTNSNVISFLAPSINGFKTLTTANYIGNNAVINLNTILGNSFSPSDNIVINGGNAQGNTILSFTNYLGKGDITTGNGILIVDTQNGGTTTADAFKLIKPLLAGPFQYTLFRGSTDSSAPDNWYLRSVTPDPSAAASDFVEGETSYVPNYRSAVSLYTALPSMELLYSRALLDTLHQRVGNEEQSYDSNHLGAWFRVLNQGGNINNGSIFEAGPDFKYHFVAFQTGFDIYHRQHADGSRDYVGIYGAFGNGNGNAEHFDGTNAGHNRFNAYTGGGYWTHFGVKNWYIDAVLQGNRLNAKSQGIDSEINPNGNIASASLEAGYPFPIFKNVVLEPQAQTIYQTAKINDTSDAISNVLFKRTYSLANRLSLQLASTWNSSKKKNQSITTWIRFSEWHEANGNSYARFPTQSGFASLASRLPGNWAQADIGISGQATKNISLYGTFSRDIYFDNHGNAYNAILGARINFA